MAGIKRVSPLEAKSLLDQGYTYLDVRTVEEFHAGHPTGAWNVPLNVAGPAGSQMNPKFAATIEAIFDRDAKIVVGCATGVRSLRAAEILTSMGYREVVDQRAGFGGSRSPFGARAEPGWAELGLPSSRGPDPGSYGALEARSKK